MSLKYRPRVSTPMIHCPYCYAIIEEVQPLTYGAIYTGSRMKCLDCGGHFIIRFETLDSRRLTHVGAVGQALEALRKLKGQLQKSEYPGWLGQVERIIGLLKNA